MASVRHETLLLGALAILTASMVGSDQSRAQSKEAADVAAKAARLIAAYPDLLDRMEGATLVWKDGTQMVFDDGKAKDFEGRLNGSDIEDQFALDYPVGSPSDKPAENVDPGRFRNEAFFDKMYGDCGKGEVSPRLVRIDWLPKHGGGRLAVTKVNGVAQKLKSVSDELEKLLETHPELKALLIPPAGVYNCRKIAGSKLKSVHAYGAAVDINTGHSDYWRWPAVNEKRAITYRNRIPYEIVEIFERHGFIWGGKWYHFDTMHFEYRPELLPPAAAPTTPK